jgi:hypothetical protein
MQRIHLLISFVLGVALLDGGDSSSTAGMATRGD